jgi:hypothetical protein
MHYKLILKIAAAIVLVVGGFGAVACFVTGDQGASAIADAPSSIVSIADSGEFVVEGRIINGRNGKRAEGKLSGVTILGPGDVATIRAFIIENVDVNYVGASEVPGGQLHLLYLDNKTNTVRVLNDDIKMALSANRPK